MGLGRSRPGRFFDTQIHPGLVEYTLDVSLTHDRHAPVGMERGLQPMSGRDPDRAIEKDRRDQSSVFLAADR